VECGPAREIRGWLALERWKEATVKAARFEPSIAGRVGVWRGRGRRATKQGKPQLFGGGGWDGDGKRRIIAKAGATRLNE